MKQELKLNRTLMNLLLIQVVASFIKFILIGQEEKYAGTILISGGSLNTIIPLASISFFLSIYYFYEKSNTYLYACLGMVFMAFVGNKRAFWFLLPSLMLVFSIIVTRTRSNWLETTIRFLRFVPIIIILGVISVYFGARLVPSLNPDGVIWGSFDLDFLIDYIISYQTGGDANSDYAAGRFGTSQAIMLYFNNESLGHQLFGAGPETFIGFSNEDGIQHDFGVRSLSHFTGFTFFLSSVGYFGAFALMFFYYSLGSKMFKTLLVSKSNFEKAFAMAGVMVFVVFLIDFTYYTRTFVHTAATNVLFFYIAAVVFKGYNSTEHSSTNVNSNIVN